MSTTSGPGEHAREDESPATGLLARIGERVRALRAARGLTAREVAARAHLSPRFYSQLESGKANIAIGRLARVAEALETPLADLVAGVASASTGSRSRALALVSACDEESLRLVNRALDLVLGSGKQRALALVGLRGAGKSTLGPLLARATGLEFVELDERIEEAAGLELAEIWSLHGEPYYRRLEGRCLAELLSGEQRTVVALPGGIVHHEEAFALLRRHAVVVWLQATPEDHMQRVQRQGDHRPMADRPDAMAELRAILASREPFYGLADVTVDTSASGPEAALRQLLGASPVASWLRQASPD